MKEISVSVIVPTYSRCNILSKCINSLLLQNVDNISYEIIVVDDGSVDNTKEMVLEYILATKDTSIRYYYQDNKGPATARNLGIRNALGRIVLFIGDDIIASYNMIDEHMKYHGTHIDEKYAVLGYTTWSKDIRITPFMKWLENGGPQFKYWSIRDKENVGYNHFYTSNISMKRDYLLKNGLFDEEFPCAAYEDIELGHRLEKSGLKIVYNEKAIGYHYHKTTLNDAMSRMRIVHAYHKMYLKKTGKKATENDDRSQVVKLLSELKYSVIYSIGYLIENLFVSNYIYSYLMDKSKTRGSISG